MTKANSDKKALLSSVFALLICVAMLIGTTFAWFTDTASTAVNRIEAGTLKVDIVKDDGETSLKGESMSFVNAEGSDDILWEPGVTFKTAAFKIKSTGTLALKYKLALNGVTGDNMLLKVIKFSVIDDNGTELDLDTFEGHLTPSENLSGKLYIQGHMDEAAGNEYQGKTLEGLGITVYATQDTVEKDSYGNQYDANAVYPEYPNGLTKDSFKPEDKAVDENGNFYTSFEEAMANVADNGTLYFKEGSTVDFPTHLNVTKNITIYGNGADFSGKDISIGTYKAPVNTETTVNIYNAKNLVVWGQPTANLSDTCTWNVNFYNCVNSDRNFLMYRGGESGTAKIHATLTNCSADGYTDSIVHTTADGSIVIKDCTFKNNCAPVNIAHKQSGTMTVTVENSKFINCGKVDPSNDYFAPVRFVNNSSTGKLDVVLKNNTFTGTVGTNGDILLGDYRTGKESHKVKALIETKAPVMVKSSSGAPYSYAGGTVAIPMVEAASQEDLKNAITNGEVGLVKLGTGIYTLYNVNNSKTTNTSLVIEGNGKENTVFTAGNLSITDASGEGSSDYSYENSDVTFNNMTVNVGKGNYKGFVRAKSLYFENCKIVGRGSYWGIGKVVFKNCEFADNADDYNIWTYSGVDFTFNGCEFKSSSGKFINAYKEQKADAKLNFIKCKFNYTGSGTPFKPAVCLKSYTGIIWNVTFTGCESNALTDSGTGSNLYSIASGMNAGTTVTVDNSVVWENGAKK